MDFAADRWEAPHNHRLVSEISWETFTIYLVDCLPRELFWRSSMALHVLFSHLLAYHCQINKFHKQVWRAKKWPKSIWYIWLLIIILGVEHVGRVVDTLRLQGIDLVQALFPKSWCGHSMPQVATASQDGFGFHHLSKTKQLEKTTAPHKRIRVNQGEQVWKTETHVDRLAVRRHLDTLALAELSTFHRGWHSAVCSGDAVSWEPLPF